MLSVVTTARRPTARRFTTAQVYAASSCSTPPTPRTYACASVQACALNNVPNRAPYCPGAPGCPRKGVGMKAGAAGVRVVGPTGGDEVFLGSIGVRFLI